ncbi:MAG: universal stress protein [Muribaculaceae bacterium]|nr:universal stress protein [Muribaculaceae bacterium]
MDNKTNNDPNRLITVAIHTFERAVELKNTLEEEGIEVVLHNVNLDEKVVASGVRVRIRERDLPQALQIIESPETVSGNKRCVLLPVDFGKYSLKSVRLGMEYARRTRGKVMLLHCYTNERHTMSLPFGSDRYDSPEDDVKAIKRTARQQMDEFVQLLFEMIAAGQLPKVKIETKVKEGIPEEQILHYAQKLDVSLIVMGTSGTNRRRQNMIGSVAGEVMDACKFPIFTVPIGMPDVSLTDITHVAFFSNLIQQDLLSFDRFARLFNMRGVEITIIPVIEKKDRKLVEQSLQQLVQYCREHYPECTFKTKRLPAKTFVDSFAQYAQDEGIQLIAVPNKKSSIFSRLFNPSIAHRVLFQTDTPMLVVPV